MPGPSHEELFAALSRLRELTSEAASREHEDWRIIVRWLRANPLRGRDIEDVHQETLMAIARRISTLDAEHPPAAVRWITTIRKRKLIDLIRYESRSPVRLGLAVVVPEDAAEPMDLLTRDDSQPVDQEALELLIENVEVAIGEHADETYPNALDRQLRKLQGRAMLRRVLGFDLDAIRKALALGQDVSDDRIYKWIERGRPVLLAGLELLRFEASEETLPLIEAMAEVANARRIDAGRPRGRPSKAGEP